MDIPFTFTVPLPTAVPTRADKHLERRLSALKGQFLDTERYQAMLAEEDRLVYEVYEIHRPEVPGELLLGISVVHPGQVGQEFFMTKGHFHTVLDTAEIYYVLKGEGFMVMETPEGACSVEALTPGKVLYVPPRWGHRSVCTARQDDLVTLFIYPANAGHDYGTIEQQGFRKLVIEGAAGIEVIDNPRWKQ
ncbi:MAG: glucose-6-phosphate isomerase [Chloroflexi bacterium]|jgi:glucose-6-phosphate isomerase|nr:glucose-6-phosphate isomerase [Chloroflexota bacterium]